MLYPQGDPLGVLPGSKTNFMLNLNKFLNYRPIFHLKILRANQEPNLCLWDNPSGVTSRLQLRFFKIYDNLLKS